MEILHACPQSMITDSFSNPETRAKYLGTRNIDAATLEMPQNTTQISFKYPEIQVNIPLISLKAMVNSN